MNNAEIQPGREKHRAPLPSERDFTNAGVEEVRRLRARLARITEEQDELCRLAANETAELRDVIVAQAKLIDQSVETLECAEIAIARALGYHDFECSLPGRKRPAHVSALEQAQSRIGIALADIRKSRDAGTR